MAKENKQKSEESHGTNKADMVVWFLGLHRDNSKVKYKIKVRGHTKEEYHDKVSVFIERTWKIRLTDAVHKKLIKAGHHPYTLKHKELLERYRVVYGVLNLPQEIIANRKPKKKVLASAEVT